MKKSYHSTAAPAEAIAATLMLDLPAGACRAGSEVALPLTSGRWR
jgi:hypothetical protein